MSKTFQNTHFRMGQASAEKVNQYLPKCTEKSLFISSKEYQNYGFLNCGVPERLNFQLLEGEAAWLPNNFPKWSGTLDFRKLESL